MDTFSVLQQSIDLKTPTVPKLSTNFGDQEIQKGGMQKTRENGNKNQ